MNSSADTNASKKIIANALGKPEVATKPLVGISSSWYPKRTLEALERLSQLLPDVTFIGIGSNLEFLYRNLSKCPLYFGLQNADDLAMVPVLFRALDALIFHLELGASTFYLLNAMSCGTPVIAVGAGNTPAELRDAVLFIQWEGISREVPCLPIEDISSKLVFLLSHPSEKVLLGEKGKQLMTNYTWHQSACQMSKLFERVISAGKDSRPLPDKAGFLFAYQYNKANGVIESVVLEKPHLFRQNIREGIICSLSEEHTSWEIKTVLDYLSQF